MEGGWRLEPRIPWRGLINYVYLLINYIQKCFSTKTTNIFRPEVTDNIIHIHFHFVQKHKVFFFRACDKKKKHKCTMKKLVGLHLQNVFYFSLEQKKNKNSMFLKKKKTHFALYNFFPSDSKKHFVPYMG